MINTREEFINSTASAVIVSKQLAQQLYKTTKNKSLRDLLSQDKSEYVILPTIKEDIVKRLNQLTKHILEIREKRVTKGGRKAIPDPENIENLSKEEKLRYNNRIWKRNSRERAKQNGN